MTEKNAVIILENEYESPNLKNAYNVFSQSGSVSLFQKYSTFVSKIEL